MTKELRALAGTWKPIATENNGYKASAGDLDGIIWIRDADGKWTMRRGDKAVVEWAVKGIDPTKNPLLRLFRPGRLEGDRRPSC